MIKSFINKVAAIQWVEDASLRNKYYSIASSGLTDPSQVQLNTRVVQLKVFEAKLSIFQLHSLNFVIFDFF